MSVSELAARVEAAGLRMLGARRFLWIPKTLPDSLLGPSQALERIAEATPGVPRIRGDDAGVGGATMTTPRLLVALNGSPRHGSSIDLLLAAMGKRRGISGRSRDPLPLRTSS